MIVDVVFGFLGSGKTTFISKVLQEWGKEQKIVVLVNEFGDVGVDGELMSGLGGDVVEMPSGCICCTLQADFKKQIFEIYETFQPDRIVIEPSGVATISTIDWILKAQTLESVIDKINKVLIVDATGFKGLYKANRMFVQSQVEGAHLVIVNKCDRVGKSAVQLTRSAVSSINPDITVLLAEYATVNWQEYLSALASSNFAGLIASGTQPARGYVQTGQSSLTALSGPGEFHLPHFQETEDALGLESFGKIFEDRIFDFQKLETFFQSLNNLASGFGEIVRAKGIFCMGEKSIVMEQASGEISSQPTRPSPQSKVTVIGKDLNKSHISAALNSCSNALENR